MQNKSKELQSNVLTSKRTMMVCLDFDAELGAELAVTVARAIELDGKARVGVVVDCYGGVERVQHACTLLGIQASVAGRDSAAGVVDSILNNVDIYAVCLGSRRCIKWFANFLQLNSRIAWQLRTRGAVVAVPDCCEDDSAVSFLDGIGLERRVGPMLEDSKLLVSLAGAAEHGFLSAQRHPVAGRLQSCLGEKRTDQLLELLEPALVLITVAAPHLWHSQEGELHAWLQWACSAATTSSLKAAVDAAIKVASLLTSAALEVTPLSLAASKLRAHALVAKLEEVGADECAFALLRDLAAVLDVPCSQVSDQSPVNTDVAVEATGVELFVCPTPVTESTPAAWSRSNMFALQRSLSEKRTHYSAAELTWLLRQCLSSVVISKARINAIFERFDVNCDGSLDRAEFPNAIRLLLGQSLRPRELEALHDIIDSTNDKIRMVDFINFFKAEEVAMKSFHAQTSNTITTVTLSPDMRFVAYGGMNCQVVVHDLDGGARRFARTCATQIGGVALAAHAEFVAIGGYKGRVEWLRLRATTTLDAPGLVATFLEGPVVEGPRSTRFSEGESRLARPSVLYSWDHDKDVYCVCISVGNEELAVGGSDNAVTIYELRSGARRYRFAQEATVWSVALSSMTCYALELEDGTRLETVRDVRFLDQLPPSSPTPHQSLDVNALKTYPGNQQMNVTSPAKVNLSTAVVSNGDGNMLLVASQTSETHSLDCKPRLVMVDGVVSGSYDDVGKGDWADLDYKLDSLPMQLGILTLVALSVALSTAQLCKGKGCIKLNDRNALAFELLATLIFLFEVTMRIICWQKLRTLRGFFADPICLVDATVVTVDMVALVAVAAGGRTRDALHPIGNPRGATVRESLRILRLLRLGRLLRATRILRSLDQTRRDESSQRYVVKYVDVTLSNGALLRHVPDYRITAKDIKTQLELLRQHAALYTDDATAVQDETTTVHDDSGMASVSGVSAGLITQSTCTSSRHVSFKDACGLMLGRSRRSLDEFDDIRVRTSIKQGQTISCIGSDLSGQMQCRRGASETRVLRNWSGSQLNVSTDPPDLSETAGYEQVEEAILDLPTANDAIDAKYGPRCDKTYKSGSAATREHKNKSDKYSTARLPSLAEQFQELSRRGSEYGLSALDEMHLCHQRDAVQQWELTEHMSRLLAQRLPVSKSAASTRIPEVVYRTSRDDMQRPDKRLLFHARRRHQQNMQRREVKRIVLQHRRAALRRQQRHLRKQMLQQLDEGTPVELVITAQAWRRRELRYVAIGGEAQFVTIWQYDLVRSRVLNRASDGGDRSSTVVACVDMRTPGLCAQLRWRHNFQHTVESVSLSADARRVAASNTKGHTIVYDFDHRCVVFRWDDAQQVFAVSLSRSGNEVAIAGASKCVRCFHVTSGAQVFHKVAHDRQRACTLSADGSVVAAGGFDGRLVAAGLQHGAEMFPLEMHSDVHSVSVDAAGATLALGCNDGTCRCYDTIGRTPKELWTAQHASKVWVVAVSPNGAYVAAGDYSNCVAVYDTRAACKLWTKASWLGTGPPFTWALAFSGDSQRLAIGHWDAYAYIVGVSDKFSQIAALRRGDRVYAIDLNFNGERLVVAGRDKTSAVYAVGGCLDRPYDLIYEAYANSFVYAAAITGDGRQIAFGCVDAAICVHDVDTRIETHHMRGDGAINSLCWTATPDGEFLAVGGEDKHVVVWQIHERKADEATATDMSGPGIQPGVDIFDHVPSRWDYSCERALVLPRSFPVQCVAFSNVSLAFASGSLATYYGKGGNECHWSDRPAFDVIVETLDHATPRVALLEKHPTCVNCANPLNGEHMLQFCARKKPAEVVEALLGAKCRFGLIPDRNGQTALGIALRNERKNIVRALLRKTAEVMAIQPLALHPFMRHRVEIKENHADIFLEFLTEVIPVIEDDLAPTGRNIALLSAADAFLVRGSRLRSPKVLWADCLDMRVHPASRASYAGFEKSPSALVARRRARCAVESPYIPPAIAAKAQRLANRAKAEHMKKVEVVALRVPFENPMGTHESLHTVNLSLLNLVAQAAAAQNSYEIFDCLLVKAMLQFKWENFAKSIYKRQFAVFLMHLAMVCVFSVCLSRTYRDRTWVRLLQSTEGVVAVALFPAVALISSIFFFIELRQLLVDGSDEYFNDSFKYLDLVTFAMQIIVDALFVTRSHFMRPACAFNILLFFFKILTFTRGFDTWGPLVRMIMKVLQEVREFIVVIMISIAGFGMAINVALGKDYDNRKSFDTPLKAMYWITKTGLYQFDVEDHEVNSSEYPDGILLFEIMM
mmetsp:Transcript_12739/g.37927  ORF Transcript_12739/g.37927 Transcript_12739/m.37927 type:complete len:2278 (-) Transcript_12739:673-7506(-)